MENSNIVCPLCEEGHLTVTQNEKADTVHGVTFKFISTSSTCDHCESTIATADMIDANAEAHTKAREAVEDQIDAAFDEERKQAGLLTSHEIRQLRNKLKLTQKEASQVFGGGIRAFSKYETCQTMQSEAMDKLMRLASEVPEAMEWLCEKANIPYGIKAISPSAHTVLISDWQKNEHAQDFKNEVCAYITAHTYEENISVKIDAFSKRATPHNKIKQNEKQGREKFSLLLNSGKNYLNSLIYS